MMYSAYKLNRRCNFKSVTPLPPSLWEPISRKQRIRQDKNIPRPGRKPYLAADRSACRDNPEVSDPAWARRGSDTPALEQSGLTPHSAHTELSELSAPWPPGSAQGRRSGSWRVGSWRAEPLLRAAVSPLTWRTAPCTPNQVSWARTGREKAGGSIVWVSPYPTADTPVPPSWSSFLFLVSSGRLIHLPILPPSQKSSRGWEWKGNGRPGRNEFAVITDRCYLFIFLKQSAFSKSNLEQLIKKSFTIRLIVNKIWEIVGWGKNKVELKVAQLVKNSPAVQETPFQFLGWEDLMEKE